MTMDNLPEYKNPISLIPGGLPQLLDYGADKIVLNEVKYTFEEIDATDAAGQKLVRLHAFSRNEEGEFVDEMDETKTAEGYGYEINGQKAILPWLDEWLPIPFLRVREHIPGTDECRFEYGPSNWARCRLTNDKGNPDKLRLVLAFDMTVETASPASYSALTHEDVDANAHFRLASRFRDNAWFLDLAWVEEWIREIWVAWHKKNRRKLSEEWQFQHLASFLVYLGVIQKICRHCEVYVIRPGATPCIDVDLVLDIGNSRTTGMLVETQTQRATYLKDSYILQLRDMTEPENIYIEPFDTKVEFREINFGNNALSMRSGRRTPAFSWPSPVRIGPEAGRLATLSRCEKGSTGMSSPKRYLWDEKDWIRSWRFNTGTEDSPYVTRGSLAQQINSSGTPLCCMNEPRFKENRNLARQEKESAFESLFTRSSLMMFLLIEIIQQALLTINSPGQRARRDLVAVPRRLNQIIFTVPAGMPMAEQRIYRRWADWAVHVLWESLGWGDYYVAKPKRTTRSERIDYRTSPVVRCEWDEATCTQLVYLYNEITSKFQGDALFFCDTIGARRVIDGKPDVPSIRVAALDIGGGTTDLSITTFELEKASGSTPRIIPHPNFHDGFNVAGDDILQNIVAKHVCAAIADALMQLGFPNYDNVIKSLFGRIVMDTSKGDIDQRVQFIHQIAIPAALCLLSLYEKSDLHAGSGKINFQLKDCFVKQAGDEEDAVTLDCPLFPMPTQNALDYVKNFVKQQGYGDDFDVLSVPITMNPHAIDETIRDTLHAVFENLGEVINRYDCDALLLTGRPSKWPSIINLINELVPVPPTRVFPMINYRVGNWYPFSDALGNMTDPKTTVVVGAILSALAEGQLEGFSFDPSNLKLGSTARYIGLMEQTGQIKKENVWFEVDPENSKDFPKFKEIVFSSPISIGFRQLVNEEWTTTRYYYMDWASRQVKDALKDKKPLKVKIRLEMPDNDQTGDKDRDDAHREGEFFVEEITDNENDTQDNACLDIRLQTLPRDDGFWMDSGVILED